MVYLDIRGGERFKIASTNGSGNDAYTKLRGKVSRNGQELSPVVIATKLGETLLLKETQRSSGILVVTQGIFIW